VQSCSRESPIPRRFRVARVRLPSNSESATIALKPMLLLCVMLGTGQVRMRKGEHPWMHEQTQKPGCASQAHPETTRCACLPVPGLAVCSNVSVCLPVRRCARSGSVAGSKYKCVHVHVYDCASTPWCVGEQVRVTVHSIGRIECAKRAIAHARIPLACCPLRRLLQGL